MIKTGVMGCAEEGHREEVSFFAHYQHDLSPLMLTLTIWLRAWLSDCCCKVIFSPLEEVTVYIPHSGSGELCSISVRKEELPNLFGSLLNGRFFSSLAFIYSIITLHHYGLQDICSIFWVVIACYLALWLKIFQH